MMELTNELTWIEISQNHLLHNINALSERAGGVHKLCAIVKGNAYGHDIETMAPLLFEAGVRHYAVYHVEEALRLRSVVGIDALIMILGFSPLNQISDLVKANIECLLLNKERLREINDAIPHGMSLNIHLKVDTGMHRFGLKPEEIHSFLMDLKLYPKLKLTGAASHFANSWNLSDPSYALKQLDAFDRALASLGEINGQLKYKHISNSAAMLTHPDVKYSFIRCGISLYGYYPNRELKEVFNVDLKLKPVLSFRSRLVSVKKMKTGEFAGYDITFHAKRPTTIALAPVGYSDGFPFAHSDQGTFVLIHGQKVPLIGRVNMNAILIDVTDLEQVRIGDCVTLLGQDGDELITVWDWMEWGTPHLYEALTSLRSGIKRVVDK